MANSEIWIATSNRNKVAEFQQLLPNLSVKSLLDLPEPFEIEENGTTFAENALIKAKALGDYLQKSVIADDSGICVLALDGFPGVYSKRWAYPVTDDHEINQLLLEKMTGLTDRRAQMETVIAFYDPISHVTETFSGVIDGEITLVPKGHDNFGYDEVFAVQPSGKTLAELGAEKNQFSHRQIAAKKFLDFYQKELNDEQKN